LVVWDLAHPETVNGTANQQLGGDVDIAALFPKADVLARLVDPRKGLAPEGPQLFRSGTLRAAEVEQSQLPWSRGNASNHAKAVRLASYLAETTGVSGPAVYNAACAFALASAEPGINPEEQRYRSNQALAYLTRLREAGYFRHPTKGEKRIQELAIDPDLDPIRNRTEFGHILDAVRAVALPPPSK
jgi:hypothetical protein